jgi:hypothetical protein
MARKTKHEVEIDIKVDSKSAGRTLGKLNDKVEGTSDKLDEAKKSLKDFEGELGDTSKKAKKAGKEVDGLGDVVGGLGKKTKKASRETKRLGDELKNTEDRLRDATGSISGFTSALGSSPIAAAGLALVGTTVAITAFTAATIKASQMGSEFALGVAASNKQLENQSVLAGLTTTEMQKWGIAGKTVGFSQEKLADILKDVNDKMGDFTATGGGAMKDFFEQIAPQVGLTAESFKGLSSSEVLGKYVKGLEDANVSQSEMTFFMEAIANDSTALIPLLLNNAEGFRTIGDEAELAGKLISEGFLEDTRDLTVAFGELETSYDAVIQDFANPIVKETTVFFKELETVLSSEAFKNSAKVMGELAAAVLSFANDTVVGNIQLISRALNIGFEETSSLVNQLNIDSIEIAKRQKEINALKSLDTSLTVAQRAEYSKLKREIEELQQKEMDSLKILKERGVLLDKEERKTRDIFRQSTKITEEAKKLKEVESKGTFKRTPVAKKKLAVKDNSERDKKKAEAKAERDAERDRLRALREEEAMLSRLGEAYANVLGIKEAGRQEEALATATDNETRMELQQEFDMQELEAEQFKLESKLAMNEATQEQLATAEAAFQKQKSNLQIKHAKDTAKREQAEARATISVIGDSLGAMSDLFSLGAKENKAFAVASKATALGEIGVATYLAATKALSIYGPTPVGYLAAGTAIASGTFNAAKVTQQQFEEGGVGGGFGGVIGGFAGSTQGPDNTTAIVRNGEMVLNSGQQRQLFDLANGSSGGGGMTLNYSPSISGDMAPESLSKALREDKAELVQIINDTITEAQFAGNF